MRLGLIGTGRIARRFVAEARFVKDVQITAVYNPHKGSAKCFVKEMWKAGDDVPKAYQKLSPFVKRVDAVYIASPHETHIGYVMEALAKGKHVLCEKPMCLDGEEARGAFALAHTKGLVLMEGIKSGYAPGFERLIEVLEDGAIGRLRYVDACFTKLEKPDVRELTDLEYGGSFLELGSYVLFPMFVMFGTKYTSMEFEWMSNGDGLDIFTKGSFRYKNAMATLTCGLGVKSEGRLLIAGETGYVVVEAPWWKLRHFEIHRENPDDVECFDNAFEGDGLRYLY